MMAAEFEARPWRGAGEFIIQAPPIPPSPAEKLEIEPPPWSLAGEVAVDATELAAEDQPLARPKPPPPPWAQNDEPGKSLSNYPAKAKP
jgi:hypothetical protein